jgi:predicted pyridoxine 5'-phosphate oxidase superfamily flavin-nucleotide-binding protein
MATTALHGWHPGEISIQRKLGYADAMKDSWSMIRNFMPEQHRVFYTSKQPFIPITTVDGDGRPWAAIVAGSTGEAGFVYSPDSQTLSVHARLWVPPSRIHREGFY